jgi:hypothetical protein
VAQVQTNVNLTLQSVLDVLHQIRADAKVLHKVVMFDELAAEKRIRWNPKTNYFLGACRQHAHKVSMDFINEGDLAELFRHLDDGDVHYAAEVRNIHLFASVGKFASVLTPEMVLSLGHHCRLGHLVSR